MSLVRLPAIFVLALLTASGCGPKAPAPAPTPASTDAAPAPIDAAELAAAPEPAPDAEPPPAPEPRAKGWVAWRQGPDNELGSALFEDRDGALTLVAERKGDAVVAVDNVVWKLGRAGQKYPLKPCGEPGDAELVDLGLTGIEPTRPVRLLTLVDTKLRPARDSNAIHLESLAFVAQAGPLVLLEHEANSDICPIPGTGATYTVSRLIDLGAATADTPIPLSDPRAVFTPDELAAAEKAALDEARTKIKAAYPAVADADLDKSLKLFDLAFRWTDEGTLALELTVIASSTAFGEGGEEATYAETVLAKALPARLAALAGKVPAEIGAFWKDHKDGRGLSPISGQAFETVRMWFKASAP